ncbi:YbjQ family protein [Kroppenstedtia eburnea]|uniref:UPF0145 protein SAMN05421790_103325 n=1 Tax=Kroppenstedtia eburnea TaxID=714067 RepID=A0A1N7KXL6_9BACL|nr:YbjQ family protein [Kroppenstedtia eburnea]EGK12685.1 protein of hypothetical function DUF74 [Desmospora sp. 8437]QKI82765.1 YbjQ family protein [Kroppenstedtia eburnea]SIS66226.1 Uncharacterized conserved protein YbjQ, UPF0145 family [Kroppenstedtia eburnea]
MIIVTTESVPGRSIREVKGMVKGSTVQAKHIGKDILAGLKNLVGGEINDYTELLTEARRVAIQRMTQEAEQLGADAIVTVRLQTSAVMDGASEIIAYGTAVVTEAISE